MGMILSTMMSIVGGACENPTVVAQRCHVSVRRRIASFFGSTARVESWGPYRHISVDETDAQRVSIDSEEMVRMYADQKARAGLFVQQHLALLESSVVPVEDEPVDEVVEPVIEEPSEQPLFQTPAEIGRMYEEQWGAFRLLELQKERENVYLELQEEREFDVIFRLALASFADAHGRERDRTRRERQREVRYDRRSRRIRDVDAIACFQEFAEMAGLSGGPVDVPELDFELIPDPAKPCLPPVGAYVGSNPIYVIDVQGHGWAFGDEKYRWIDPRGQNQVPISVAPGVVAPSALPPCAVPYPHTFGWIRRAYTRRLIGPIWWETSVSVIKPRPGDILISKVGAVKTGDARYFQNGCWDLTRVQNVQCGRRMHRLSGLVLHTAGNDQWQIRQICYDTRTVPVALTWDPVTKGVFRRELDHPRPIMVPCGKTWEATVMSIQAPTVEATLRLRYEAVIRVAQEEHVAALRQHLAAALKERDLKANPVQFMRALTEVDAAARVHFGLQPDYAPK